MKMSIEIAKDMLGEIPKGAEAAMARAFNRALATGRAAATREVTKRYTVKAKEVRSTFRLKRATKNDLSAEITSSGSALPMSAFKHRPAYDTTGAQRKPIRVTIKNGETHTFTTSFVWDKAGGNIFTRLGSKRLPIEKMTGPSVPSMMGNEDIVESVQGAMLETAEKRLEHELARLAEGN